MQAAPTQISRVRFIFDYQPVNVDKASNSEVSARQIFFDSD